MGFAPNSTPEPGEKLICLRNNANLGLYNGMTFTVESVEEDPDLDVIMLDLVDDLGNVYQDVKALSDQFNQERTLTLNRWQMSKQINLFDFGYAQTGHKSQGSEYNKVLALEELHPGFPEDHHRWRYTVVSRAKTQLVYCR